MIFNIFFDIDGSLVNLNDIQEHHRQNPEIDWYYFSGSVELVNSNGEILLDKRNLVDIFPFFREFFITISQYKSVSMRYKEQVDNKLCTRTSLYYINTPTMIFHHKNDVYMDLSIYHNDKENNIKVISINEEINKFYNAFKNTSLLFLEKAKLIFPDEKIEVLDCIDNLLRDF